MVGNLAEGKTGHQRSASASVPSTPGAGSSSPFASIRNQLTGLDDLVLATVLKLPQQPTSGTATKEPLSIQTTSVNFRRFVAKSGWIFIAQDAAEAVVRWESTPKTLFFAALWAFLCLYPIGFLLIPNVALTATLLYTHQTRPVPTTPKSPEVHSFGAGLNTDQPQEGSVDYLANLQGIQIMMGRLSDLADFGRSLLPFITWQHEPTSQFLLQLSALSTILAVFVYPYIPWRFVFLLAGELGFVAGHPRVVGLVSGFAASRNGGAAGANGLDVWEKGLKRVKREVDRVVEEDSWDDDVLAGSDFVEVEQYESERWSDGAWVGDVSVGGALPSTRHRWVPGTHWAVDEVGDWAGGKVDGQGFTYVLADGRREPRMVVGGGAAVQSRRRRLVRKAYVPRAEAEDR